MDLPAGHVMVSEHQTIFAYERAGTAVIKTEAGQAHVIKPGPGRG